MRIATYNVEWFSSLFTDNGRLIDDDGWSGRRDVTKAQQTKAVGKVFQALDADIIMVIEAPDTHKGRSGTNALEHFAARFDLRARRALLGFSNTTQQEIMVMYDPDVVTMEHDPIGTLEDGFAPRFDGALGHDVNVDTTPEAIKFSKPPLEVKATTGDGKTFRMIGVHAKSKAPHGAKNDADAKRISIENRRKQLAQCIWLRRRITSHLDDDTPLIVLGDLNDGPGLDEFEKLFGHSGVEIVLGTGDQTPMFDPHAREALMRGMQAPPTTSRFYKHREKRFLSALLDYIMVSPDLCAKGGVWQIWHPFDAPDIFKDADLRDALLSASDHFPVTLDIDL